ncbi:MAG: PEP-CTERM sorting domain-containing protein [Planctomycetota bacterium]
MTWIAASGVSVLAWYGTAEAALIAQFTATLNEVSAQLSDGFNVGETVVGFYQFDETTLDSNDSAFLADYLAIDDFRVEFSGGYTASATSGEIEVDDFTTSTDTYLARSLGPVTGTTVSGSSPVSMRIELLDLSATAFDSDALPLSLDLTDFDIREFTIFFSAGQITGELTSLSIVPEPASFILIGLGALLIGARPRGRIRCSASKALDEAIFLE